ncbi:hypothetical protein M0805_002971 [Coniferiporia weirii]|nr:hypothetical protein M0805_002971 [Coniferiporia weirii]
MPPRRTMGSSPTRVFTTVLSAFIAAVKRMDKSLDPRDTVAKLQRHQFSLSDSVYVFLASLALFWVYLWPLALLFKLLLVAAYITILFIPFTSQFFVPATPILAWVITFFSSRLIPVAYRPTISVSLLPTLESVLYGANISDILTRFTHPVLDILAWLPYGVLHYTLPFVVSAFIWLFRPKEALHFWGRAFGYLNLIAVLTQLIIPCAAPWYELIYGLTPATYAVHGSAGGLARIDALFGSQAYQNTFASSPLVFGAFPSLHAGWATIEALFWSHFFPSTRTFAWAYAGVLYWATMYLTHHYLVDVVGGACLATACFYLFLPHELRGAGATRSPGSSSSSSSSSNRGRSKHELYDLEVPRRSAFGLGHTRGLSGRGLRLDRDGDADADDYSDADAGASSAEEQDITYRSPSLPASAVPLMGPAPPPSSKNKSRQGHGHSHKHTASIVSLTRGAGVGANEDGGWSPIGGGGGVGSARAGGFALPRPSTPSRAELGEAYMLPQSSSTRDS